MNYARLLDLSGRGYLVLGAGQGIGHAVCQALHQCGAQLVCVYSNAELAQRVAREVNGAPFVGDVTVRSDMQAAFKLADEVLPHPAGVVDIIGRAHMAPIEEVDDELFLRQTDIVFRHAWLATQLGAPWLARNGGGSMAFIGSISGVAAYRNQALYGAQKAALHHLATCSAVEYGPRGVRVNAVVAGTTKTPRLIDLIGAGWKDVERLIPLRRAASTADIASVVLFLMSDLSRHVTGQRIVVDGGATAVGHRPQPQHATDLH